MSEETYEKIVRALDTLRKNDPELVLSTVSLVRKVRDPNSRTTALARVCLDNNFGLWEAGFTLNDQVRTAIDDLRQSVLDQETF